MTGGSREIAGAVPGLCSRVSALAYRAQRPRRNVGGNDK